MVPLGVFVLSHDTKIVFWNRCFEDWTGITAQTAVQLEEALGIAADYWMSLRTAYELTLARNERRASA